MPPQIYIIKGRLHTDIASAKRTDDGLYLIGYINNPGQKYYYKLMDVIIANALMGGQIIGPTLTESETPFHFDSTKDKDDDFIEIDGELINESTGEVIQLPMAEEFNQ